jgi:hypothetical protein
MNASGIVVANVIRGHSGASIEKSFGSVSCAGRKLDRVRFSLVTSQGALVTYMRSEKA